MEITTFEQAITYVESLIEKALNKPYRQDLDRITYLLDKLGNPHTAYPTVHVGGTSGKTSTSTMIADVLTASGYKTGLHISPHLEDIRERMQIDRKFMSEDQFVQYVQKLKPIVKIIEQDTDLGTPSYFEMLLALCFLYFKDEQVDVAVIEVGLGGKLDGTNVITPLVSILTNVGLDHTEILGDTVEKIAHDKVGIFKHGAPVISGVTQPSVIEIVKQKAQETHSALQIIHHDFDADLPPFQRKNAALAQAALKVLQTNFKITDETINSILSAEHVPGRFEIILSTNNDQRSTVILDGAHNLEKIKALKEALVAAYPDQKFVIVFAVKKDKKRAEMLAELAEIAEKFYFTRFFKNVDMGRALSVDPKELVPLTSVTSSVTEDPTAAVELAIKENPTDIVCVTGSLYLVGEVRNSIKHS